MNLAVFEKPVWPRWASAIMPWLLLIAGVCLVMDRDAAKALAAASWVLLGLAALTDGAPRRARWLPFLGGALFIAAAVGVTVWQNPLGGEVAKALIRYQIIPLWLATWWLALPIVQAPRAGWLAGVAGWVRLLTALVVVLAFIGTISAAASLFPKDSVKLLGSELLPYAGIFTLVIRMAQAGQPVTWKHGLRGLWVIAALASLAMAGCVLWMGFLVSAQTNDVISPTAQLLMDWQLFRLDEDAFGMPRLQFLFEHHNRAGYFLACAVFLCLAGAPGKKWRWTLGLLGAAAAAFALPFTLTRGALLAAAAGISLFAVSILLRQKGGLWILILLFGLGGTGLWVMIPPRYKAHIERIINPANYQEGQGGSIGARFTMWSAATDMIAKRPWLGFGYGFENFESAAQMEHPEIPDYFKHSSHAHNTWLETAAEIGLPGALILLSFTLLRMAGLAITAWYGLRRRQPGVWLLALWLGLEVAIQLYGLTNYSLRRGLGLMTYGIWAGSLVLVIQWAKRNPFARGEGVESALDKNPGR